LNKGHWKLQDDVAETLQGGLPMTKTKDTTFFENKLAEFITDEDPLFSMLKWLTDQLMEIEVNHKLNATKGKHEQDRSGYRCGYRPRRFDTRLGTMYLMVPRIRKGGYIPFFVTEKRRSEHALIQVVNEAWQNGISTRKIDHLAKAMGIDGISASQVSELNKGLDSMVYEFRNRKLEEEYPVIWIDALYEKIRDDHHIENMAVMVVKGINMQGNPEILAVEPMQNESEDTYRALFARLKERGLKKVWLCVSDAHLGLQAAIRKCFIGSEWQRCKVHFMRNILAHVNEKEKAGFAVRLKQIWLEPDKESAIACAKRLIEQYGDRFPQAIECLENGLLDSLSFYDFPEIDARKISSTNTLERLNKEIRRRSRVVGIFPSMSSYIRLITSYLIEYEEDWISGRNYIKSESLMKQRQKLKRVA
jgi:transposase-like protein